MESLCEKWKALPSIPNESSVVFALGLASEVFCGCLVRVATFMIYSYA